MALNYIPQGNAVRELVINPSLHRLDPYDKKQRLQQQLKNPILKLRFFKIWPVKLAKIFRMDSFGEFMGYLLIDKGMQPFSNTLFQQHKRRLYTWTLPDGQHQNQTDYILCSQKCRSSIQSAKTRPGADYCSEHALLIAKFRLEESKENH